VQVLRSLSTCENILYAPRDFGRPADGLLTLANLGGIGKDFVGLEVCRGTAGMNTVMTPGGGTFRLQFAPAALSVCSHASGGYIYSLAVGALFLFGSPGLLLPWTRLWAVRLDARPSPSHHSRVVVLVSSCVPVGLT